MSVSVLCLLCVRMHVDVYFYFFYLLVYYSTTIKSRSLVSKHVFHIVRVYVEKKGYFKKSDSSVVCVCCVCDYVC